MIPDLHPEELLDKAAQGRLTDEERVTLDAHLAECAVCRFARQATLDFARLPMPALDVDHLVTNALTARVTRSLRPRSRRGATLLAVAVVLAAMGSFAAVGQWTGVLPRLLRAVSRTTFQRPGPSATSPAARGSPRAAEQEAAALDLRAPPVVEPPPVPALVEAMAPPPPVAPATRSSAHVRRPSSTRSARTASVGAKTPGGGLGAVGGGRDGFPARGVAPSAASAAEPPAGAESAADAFVAANQARLSGDRPLAMAWYRELLARWPTSPEAQQTRATLGRMLLDGGSAAAALEQLDAYLRAPDAALREEVLSARALALMRLGRVDEEARAWQVLIDHYPDSIHARRARARLGALPDVP